MDVIAVPKDGTARKLYVAFFESNVIEAYDAIAKRFIKNITLPNAEIFYMPYSTCYNLEIESCPPKT